MATEGPSGEASAVAGVDIPSAAELIERARALAPLLAQNVERCEVERRVPDENIDLIKQAGLYKVLQPRTFGGYELDFGVYVELAYELGKGCTSTAWVYENNCMHSLLVGYMSEQVQHELWVDRRDTIISTGWAPREGHAVKTDGGYMCNGQWGAASGAFNCWADLLNMPVINPETGALIEMRFFLLFRDLNEYEIVDTWHSSGLQGTGSNDIRVSNLFVPEYRTILWNACNKQPDSETGKVFLQGCGVHHSIWYSAPCKDWMHWTIIPALAGGAQTAFDATVARLQNRTNLFGQKLGDTQSVQLRMADAQTKIDWAMLSLRHDVAECQHYYEAGSCPPRAARARWRSHSASQAQLLNEAMASLRYRDGFNGAFSHQPLQRAHRDITTGTAHIGTDFDVMGGTYGRAMLGIEDPTDPLKV